VIIAAPEGNNDMKKILVVDNDVMILKFMSDLLEKEGHHVLTSQDGISALEKLKSYRPDIIFIDLIMPNIDGERLSRTIRKIPELNHVHIVIVSAVAAEEKIDVSEFGANACIAKGPFERMSGHILYALDRLDNETPDIAHGNIIGLENIHSRKITRELLSCKRHYDAILNNISEGILELNINNKIIYANPFAYLITGISEEKLLGLYLTDIFDDSNKVRVMELFDQADSGQQKINDDLPLILNEKMVSMNILPVHDGDGKSVIVILNDITERKRMENEIRDLSLRDHLTNLYNRRGFISLAEQQIKMAQRSEKKIQLTFIDVDDLKLINDDLGHDEGDKALTETAHILQHAFRQSDIIARIGGDEFAVLSIDISDLSSQAFSKRLQEKIDEFNAKDSRKYELSMSWGAAVFDPKAPVSMDELMSSADKLMYTQKRKKLRGC
jgi:diguanylate cyclase (GGDEF)-like protein/PAS domain S-box-containing protein